METSDQVVGNISESIHAIMPIAQAARLGLLKASVRTERFRILHSVRKPKAPISRRGAS